MVTSQNILRSDDYFVRFREVNRRSSPYYRQGFQKHHLIPLSMRRYRELHKLLLMANIRLDNFTHNGLLLPSRENIAYDLGLPLHRGPHPHYSDLVAQRLFMVWQTAKYHQPNHAAQRLKLLQRALKRSLCSNQKLRKPLILNRRDPLNSNIDFSHIDMAIDILWAETEVAISQSD